MQSLRQIGGHGPETIVECVAVLVGLPAAALGAGIAVLWMARTSGEPDHPQQS